MFQRFPPKTQGKNLKLKEKTQNSRKILRFPASLKTIDGRDVHKKKLALAMTNLFSRIKIFSMTTLSDFAQTLQLESKV